MKDRNLTKWTFTRAFYLIMGCVVIIQSILSNQWFGVALGGYFALMGLLAFGCASWNCFGDNCRVEQKQKASATIEE